MGDFFAELRRRHIYRVGAAYVVVAWVITQVLDVFSQLFALPAWIAQPIVIVLAIGLPITLVVAWMIEGKAHEAVASAVRSPATTVDWVLAGAVAVVIVLIGYQQLTPSAPLQAGVEAARLAADSPDTAVSVAVLPFANISGDPAQQFFSDGMTEEISFALAKVPNLRVVARTSAFQFREQDRDFQSIGQALNATHFIDGSVRQDGERVRITARLIEANDSTQVWAENYDRELTDVFVIQEEIATAIAGALNMQLGLASGENLVSSRTNDPQSYRQYLQAKALMNARSAHEAVALLEPLVARDSDYAPAWALLSLAYIFEAGTSPLLNYGTIEEASSLVETAGDKAEMAAQEAIRLDPEYASGYASLGFVERSRRRFVIAEDLRLKALELDPGDTETIERYSQNLVSSGRIQEGLLLKEQLATFEQFVPAYKVSRARTLLLRGENQAAIEILEAVTPDETPTGYSRNIALATAYAAAGRFADASDIILSITPAQTGATDSEGEEAARASRSDIEEAARLLRLAPRTLLPEESVPIEAQDLSFVYAFFGAYDRVLDGLERMLEIEYGTSGAGTMIWAPYYAPMRKMERFEAYVHNFGLYDYWRERGFADQCRPVGDDDFECD